jgi:hypothetical protein
VEVIFARVDRSTMFTGDNAEEIMDVLASLGYPNAYISASANYPGASATVQIFQDIPNNGGYPMDFNVGDFYSHTTGGFTLASSMADTKYFVPLAEFIRTAAPQPAMAVGYEITPNLEAGASATVQVPMVPNLPDAGYNVSVALSGSAQLLGSLQIIGHTVVSASAVNVSVQNNNGSLELGGATVLVTALHNG